MDFDKSKFSKTLRPTNVSNQLWDFNLVLRDKVAR